MAPVVSRWVAPAVALAALLVGVVILVAQSRDEGPTAAGPTTSPSIVIEAGPQRGCIPFAEALGADATVEDQDAVLAARDLTLTEILPFGICNEVTPMAEPTGL